MSPKLSYQITIQNIFNDRCSNFNCDGPIKNVSDRINEHFGLELVSPHICSTIVSRPSTRAKRLKGITIIPFQKKTSKYPQGVNERY